MNAQDFSNQLCMAADGQLSISEFEDWFELNSWNVHKLLDKQLVNAVFEAEEAFSAHSDYRMSSEDLRRSFSALAGKLTKKDLANAIRPFESKASDILTFASRCLPWKLSFTADEPNPHQSWYQGQILNVGH